jgi:serine/threonine protein kinase
MGEVYRARDTRLDRTVALKVLPAHLSQDPERRQRFEREAKTISSLNHPNICTLHDIGQQDGVDYLVLEHLEGESLAARLEKGPLPLEQALRCGAEIADALARAHDHGVVHRDLKPGNAFLTRSGAKLLDFGLAKLAPALTPLPAPGLSALATEEKPLTEAGTVMGTYPYMSPEQLEGKEADARTDVFALGALLFEMLTGRPAFGGKSAASVIAAVLGSEPPPVSQVRPMTPLAVDHLVRVCLAKDPEELSPDGRKLVYAGRTAEGDGMLFLRPLDTLEARPMPGTEGAYDPFWSPDGKEIAFLAEERLDENPPIVVVQNWTAELAN